MNSTELIKAVEADYQMLKDKGKQGEKVLHQHGYLDGYGQGCSDAANYTRKKLINKACKWLEDNCKGYTIIDQARVYDMSGALRKALKGQN